MPKAPFPITPELTAIAIGYRNKRMIADEVLPRVPVGKEEFKYWKFDLSEGFTVPDTKVGRKSKPNEMEFSADEATASTEDYGLEDPIPNKDIDNAPDNYDPMGRSTEQLTNVILLDREVRTSGLVFNNANYGANNKIVLSGTDQFSDQANSKPIQVIMDSLDTMIMRGNVMTIGRTAFSALAQHPDILKAVHANSGDKGIATREAIAALFELDDIFVGEARVNTAKKGQAVNLQRAWGGHISLMYRDKLADTRHGTTFGFTAQFGNRIAGSQPDGDIGLRGGQRVRVGESVKELLTANDLGYFIENVV